jgi:plasmid replication initiation protein
MAGKTKILELKKHVGTIHSSNSLSLLQRKIANALLYNAYDDLLTKEEHEITISSLCKIIGYSSHDHKTIKNALKKLLSTVIEWNLVDGGRIETDGAWNASSIISDAGIDGSICTYSYSNKMKKLLYRPDLYGRIDMVVQAKFQSTYGLALYENCIRYQDIGQTPWIEIAKFRKLMGIPDDKYKIFRDFKRRVLDAAIEEVNKYSQIKVTPQFKKIARQVVSIQFLIQRSERNEKQAVQLSNGINHNLIDLLKIKFGLSKKQTDDILILYSENYIRDKIHLIESSPTFVSGKVKNLARYLVCALKEDYQLNKSTEELADKKNDFNTNPIELNRRREQSQREEEQSVLDKFHHLSEKEKKMILKKFEVTLRGLYRDAYFKDGLENYQIKRELYNFLRFKIFKNEVIQ